MKKLENKYRKYLNAPYKHLGRDLSGLDCFGLLILYYKDFKNIKLKDWYYEEDWHKKGHNHILEKSKYYNFIEVNDFQKDDVVLLKMDLHSKIPNHVCIIVQPPNIGISAEKGGVMLIDLNRNILKRRIYGVYRCQN